MDVTRRNTRPTSTFAFEDLFAVEIWSPEPSLDSPAGQAAAQVHSAIARVPQARHHDLPTAASSACPPTPAAPGPDVRIPAFLFCPADLAVAAGTEVRWNNDDAAPHSATATGAEPAFDSGTLTTGQTFSFRFDRPGLYEYFCRLHPSMRGTVTVTAA
ncbi:MAG: plastocyanin/azurin family copper-binding protein [Acidimicrobiia bacterium]